MSSSNRSILITGGTGSFARAYIKRVLALDTYERIVVYSRCEHKQETMREELNDDRIRYFLGDVRDKERLNLAMRGCNYVLHTAALKIVPKLERDPIEAVKTNIQGTQNVIECALNASMFSGTKFYPEPRIVLNVSSDKAVSPINLYGATKLAAEKLISAANVYNKQVKFATVRWGNVAGSKSSVIPLFKQQHKAGALLTVTNENMTRFWITLDDAARFTWDIFTDIAEGLEHKTLNIPEMPAYKVKDLITAIAGKKAKTKLIGLRPGEKMHESILTHEERDSLDMQHHVVSSDLARRMSVAELRKLVKLI